MVQALRRRAGLRQIEIFAKYLFRSLSLSAQPLRQAPISVFREAMTLFIRLGQPNKTSVFVCG